MFKPVALVKTQENGPDQQTENQSQNPVNEEAYIWIHSSACFWVSTARPALCRNQGWERPLDFYVCFYSPTSWEHVKPTWLQLLLGGFLFCLFL